MTRAAFAVRAGVAVAVTTALCVLVRWQVIGFSGWVNPDEAELLAAGRRAAIQLWLPMSTASANTYFPLWPTSLGLLDLLGVPLTLRAGHLMSAFAYALVISTVWIVSARRWGWLWPVLFVAPPAYWILTAFPDFMELGTELPSVLLLVLGAVIAFPHQRTVSGRRLALVAAIASLAPWYKPQSGPLALGLVLSACGFAYLARRTTWSRKEWAHRGAWLALGGLGPTALLLMLMAVGGTIHLFWSEPVGFSHAYLTHSVKGIGVGSSTAPMTKRVGQLLHQLWLSSPVFAWTLVGLRGWSFGSGRRGLRLAAYVAIWATPVLAALATLLILWPIFPHYLNLLWAGTAIAAIAGSGLGDPSDSTRSSGRGRRSRRRASRWFVPGWRGRAAALSLLASLALGLQATTMSGAEHAFGARPPHQGNQALAKLCPAGGSVFVWGWAPELYAYYDWQPASRYVTYALLKARTPRKEEYRARFLDEMASDPPRCIVDAVGPGWFGSSTKDPALETAIPESRRWLERDYEQNVVEFTPEDRISVWTRTDLDGAGSP